MDDWHIPPGFRPLFKPRLRLLFLDLLKLSDPQILAVIENDFARFILLELYLHSYDFDGVDLLKIIPDFVTHFEAVCSWVMSLKHEIVAPKLLVVILDFSLDFVHELVV